MSETGRQASRALPGHQILRMAKGKAAAAADQVGDRNLVELGEKNLMSDRLGGIMIQQSFRRSPSRIVSLPAFAQARCTLPLTHRPHGSPSAQALFLSSSEATEYVACDQSVRNMFF